MRIIDKIKMIDNISLIFSIKIGKLIKKNNKCYQVPKWFAIFFKIYYSAPIFFIFLFLLMPHFFSNLYLQICESLVVYLIIEYLMVLLIPLKEIKCKKYS